MNWSWLIREKEMHQTKVLNCLSCICIGVTKGLPRVATAMDDRDGILPETILRELYIIVYNHCKSSLCPSWHVSCSHKSIIPTRPRVVKISIWFHPLNTLRKHPCSLSSAESSWKHQASWFIMCGRASFRTSQSQHSLFAIRRLLARPLLL